MSSRPSKRDSRHVHWWVQAGCLILYLVLFCFVAWPYTTPLHADRLTEKEWLPLELFLWMDPLAGVATAVAGRAWTLVLIGAAGTLVLAVFFPRAFCGFICPLGTLHDVFEWAVGRHWRRWNVQNIGAWRHLRYLLLTAVLVAALCGVMLAGYVAAIPVVTRGMMFSLGWLQTGLFQNWSSAGPLSSAMVVSLGWFVVVMLTGLLGHRFWCRYLCPTGAFIGLAGLLRINQRRVTKDCTECGLCVRVCGFDAIALDISTRVTDCASCQTCVHVCPQDAIYFGQPRAVEKPAGTALEVQTPLVSRRAWLGSVAGGLAVSCVLRSKTGHALPPLRPPGSVPEEQFLDLCVRCGECFKVCPGAALEPAGWEQGWEGLWSPMLVPTHAACHPDCNFCTQACPTGAIRPLTLAEKRKFVIGVARLDPQVCLPLRGERDCQLCFDECKAAGYNAIEMRPIPLQVGAVPANALDPREEEAMGTILAPFIRPELCVGCGLCEYRCHAAVHRQQKLIPHRAIWVELVPSQIPS